MTTQVFRDVRQQCESVKHLNPRQGITTEGMRRGPGHTAQPNSV